MPTNNSNTPKTQSPSTEPQAQGSMASLRGLATGIVFLLVVLGVLVFIGAKAVSKAPEPPVPPAAPGETGALLSPAPITAVSDEGQKTTLRQYFKIASPANFKEEFLAAVPVEAAGAYNEFTAATGEAKLGTARNFFIYLNNPAVNRSDPGALAFLEDVKSDLEKTLGQPLF